MAMRTERKRRNYEIFTRKKYLIVNLTTLRCQGLKEDFKVLNLGAYKSDLATN